MLTTKQPAIGRGSGRRELANWIASADNPLTARVMANRVWLHLIGRGLVPTPDNFGANGQPASHPALLVHLALSFAENGTRDDLLVSIRAVAADAAAAVQHFREIAEMYAAGKGEYPKRFGLSGLALRLLAEQQAATLRWATWAERVVAGWDGPLATDATWGVKTLRGSGEPFSLDGETTGGADASRGRAGEPRLATC